MKNELFLIVLSIGLLFTSCLTDDSEIDYDSLSNAEKMQLLDIEDASIWNTLCTQSLSDDETEVSASLKSAQKVKEYPSKDDEYYYAMFEDLYPSKGDYDFNDVILRSKLGWGKSGSTHTGYVSTTLMNKGGSLSVNVGLMFYEVSGSKYTRIPYEDISVNDTQLSDGPWMAALSDLGDEWTISYEFENKSSNIWIGYFIEADGVKILTSGFAPVDTEEFTVPSSEYLTEDNLPWGMEIETDVIAVPNEKVSLLDAFPLFEEWATSGGTKNKKWYESPDGNNTFYNK